MWKGWDPRCVLMHDVLIAHFDLEKQSEEEGELEELRRLLSENKEKEKERELEIERLRALEKARSDTAHVRQQAYKPEKEMTQGKYAKRNQRIDDTAKEDDEPAVIVGGAFDVLGQIDEEGNRIERLNENEIDPGPANEDWVYPPSSVTWTFSQAAAYILHQSPFGSIPLQRTAQQVFDDPRLRLDWGIDELESYLRTPRLADASQ
nr:hypothetical protein Iba_chr13cCG18780 [Ipomoea batatas]